MFGSHLDLCLSEHVLELYSPHHRHTLLPRYRCYLRAKIKSSWSTVPYFVGTIFHVFTTMEWLGGAFNILASICGAPSSSARRGWLCSLKSILRHFCPLLFAEQQMLCVHNWPEQQWGAWVSACGWHRLKRTIRAHIAAATRSPLVTHEGCFRVKAPRPFVSLTVPSTALPECHAKNPGSPGCGEIIPNDSWRTPRSYMQHCFFEKKVIQIRMQAGIFSSSVLRYWLQDTKSSIERKSNTICSRFPKGILVCRLFKPLSEGSSPLGFEKDVRSTHCRECRKFCLEIDIKE